MFPLFNAPVRAAAAVEVGAASGTLRRSSRRSATSRSERTAPVSTEEVVVVVERVNVGARITVNLQKKMKAAVKSVRAGDRVMKINTAGTKRVSGVKNMRAIHMRVKEYPECLRVVGMDLKCFAEKEALEDYVSLSVMLQMNRR
mmetsp:Transcript_19997/g.45051  ORF Transcript_19997/g.45051 Transcript_19997/m.45051 type:complete len:144 (-) Transcript_19997:37-468(-)